MDVNMGDQLANFMKEIQISDSAIQLPDVSLDTEKVREEKYLCIPQIETFTHNYSLIVPVLDGHDVENASIFISIEKAAADIIHYINERRQGKVFAICGVSLGATIFVEMLT